MPPPGKLFEVALLERAYHYAVDVHALEHSHGVANGLSAAELYVGGGQEDGHAAQLPDALLE